MFTKCAVLSTQIAHYLSIPIYCNVYQMSCIKHTNCTLPEHANVLWHKHMDININIINKIDIRIWSVETFFSIKQIWCYHHCTFKHKSESNIVLPILRERVILQLSWDQNSFVYFTHFRPFGVNLQSYFFTKNFCYRNFCDDIIHCKIFLSSEIQNFFFANWLQMVRNA